MDLITLARLQFGATTVYHFLFVPLTLGLSVLVAWMQWKYYKTNNDGYDKLARYFGTLFLINFAMGVVTGIVQEFQFGMNWSNYSRFVGDIFGAPLAVEALAAFFLESTFLGLWIFGRNKLSKKAHLATIMLVAFASNLSALWIIIANSFMQQPVAFAIKETAYGPRAEMTNFFDLITNPHVWLQYPHTVLAGFTTAATFVLAIAAINILKKNQADVFKLILRPVAIFGLVSIIGTIGFGDLQGKNITVEQPMKLAAAEALWETTDKAPFSIVALVDEKNGKNDMAIEVPYLLSILATNDPNATIKGINDLQAEYEQKYGPGDYKPPVTLSFWSFRIMIYAGSLLMLILLLSVVFAKKIEQKPWFLKVMLLALPLPYLCNSFGWIFTESGRQPWVVQGVLQIKDAVSTSGAVTPTTVGISLIGFILLYGILAALDIYLSVKFIKHGFKGLDHVLKEESEVQNVW